MKTYVLYVLPCALLLAGCGDGNRVGFDPVTGTEMPGRQAVSGPGGEGRVIGVQSPVKNVVSGPDGEPRVIGYEDPGSIQCLEGITSCDDYCACIGYPPGCLEECRGELAGGRPGGRQPGGGNPGGGNTTDVCIDACLDAGFSDSECDDICN